MGKDTTYCHSAKFACLRNIPRQTADLYLVHCGHHVCPNGYTYNHKVPTEYHLHFVLKGKGIISVDNVHYSVQEEEIFLIPKGSGFSYIADKDSPWEYIWVTFDGNVAEKYLSWVDLTKDHPVIKSSIPTKSYWPLVAKIFETSELTHYNELLRVGYLFEILSLLIKSQSANKKDGEYDYKQESYVEYAVDMIVRNYKTMKISELADKIGISRAYLSVIFKKTFNMSPQEYLISFRLSKAEKALLQTNDSVNIISENVGYADSFAFSKAFKQKHGISPKQYREEKKDVQE